MATPPTIQQWRNFDNVENGGARLELLGTMTTVSEGKTISNVETVAMVRMIRMTMMRRMLVAMMRMGMMLMIMMRRRIMLVMMVMTMITMVLFLKPFAYYAMHKSMSIGMGKQSLIVFDNKIDYKYLQRLNNVVDREQQTGSPPPPFPP